MGCPVVGLTGPNRSDANSPYLPHSTADRTPMPTRLLNDPDADTRPLRFDRNHALLVGVGGAIGTTIRLLLTTWFPADHGIPVIVFVIAAEELAGEPGDLGVRCRGLRAFVGAGGRRIDVVGRVEERPRARGCSQVVSRHQRVLERRVRARGDQCGEPLEGRRGLAVEEPGHDERVNGPGFHSDALWAEWSALIGQPMAGALMEESLQRGAQTPEGERDLEGLLRKVNQEAAFASVAYGCCATVVLAAGAAGNVMSGLMPSGGPRSSPPESGSWPSAAWGALATTHADSHGDRGVHRPGGRTAPTVSSRPPAGPLSGNRSLRDLHLGSSCPT